MTDRPADAEGLLAHAGDVGEIRRLTLFFADLVDSTALSTQVDPETYRLVVGRYREQVLRIVSGYDGHIGSTKGDGLLAVFGHPIAREDDARRAGVRVINLRAQGKAVTTHELMGLRHLLNMKQRILLVQPYQKFLQRLVELGL